MDSTDQHSPRFVPTRWSIVLAARQADSPQAAEALATLCQSYWYPLYAFVRRQGHNPPDAQDLTQGFFARLIEKHSLARIQRGTGSGVHVVEEDATLVGRAGMVESEQLEVGADRAMARRGAGRVDLDSNDAALAGQLRSGEVRV